MHRQEIINGNNKGLIYTIVVLFSRLSGTKTPIIDVTIIFNQKILITNDVTKVIPNYHLITKRKNKLSLH